jgi:hypothetical protein
LVIVDEKADPDAWSNKSNWKPSLVTFLADSDQDGLPDEWEILYGFDPRAAADATLDSDGDTMSNLAEYIAGTDPTDPSSYLKINLVTDRPGATLEFLAISNRTYTVEFTDAIGKSPWQKLTDVGASSANHLATLNDPVGVTNRFYRLLTPRRP